MVKKLFYAAFGVLALWCASFLIFCISGDWAVRGQFGDMFGAVNSLFSGLAFAGLIITLIYQRNDLDLQRKAITQTNKEMERQTKEFEEQNMMAKREQFQNTFFELLRMLQTISNDLNLELRDKNGNIHSYRGKTIFKELFDERGQLFVDSNLPLSSVSKEAKDHDDYDYIGNSDRFSFLYHYFRFVYRIMKFVDETDVLKTTEEKYKYIAFLRSTLSNHEVAAIFYNCLSKNGVEKFKPLVEKYAMFDNVDTKILGGAVFKKKFKASAYEFMYRVHLSVESSSFKMRTDGTSTFQYEVNFRVKANYGDVKISSISLNNKEGFTGYEMNPTKRLFYKKVFANRVMNFEATKFADFFELAKKKNEDIAVNTKDIVIKDGETLNICFLDQQDSIKEFGSHSEMPLNGWSCIVEYQDGRSLLIPLSLQVVGEHHAGMFK